MALFPFRSCYTESPALHPAGRPRLTPLTRRIKHCALDSRAARPCAAKSYAASRKLRTSARSESANAFQLSKHPTQAGCRNTIRSACLRA